MKTLKRCTSLLLLLALFTTIVPIPKNTGNDYPISVCGDDDISEKDFDYIRKK